MAQTTVPRHGTTPTLDSPHSTRRRLTATQRALIGMEAVMGLPGIGGGIYMVTHPTTMMPLGYLAHTPFADWTLPGVFLTVFVGGGGVLAAGLQLARAPVAEIVHYAAGMGMILWIVVEAIWVVWAPSFQVPYTLLGIAITLAAVVNSRHLRMGDSNAHP